MVNISSHISFGMAVLKYINTAERIIHARSMSDAVYRPWINLQNKTSKQREMDLLLVLRSLAAEACN